MITDPDQPGYRFPQPGERYWHAPWECWVVIEGDTPYGHVPDEVAALRESDGQKLVVKLRSLDEPSDLC